MIISYPWADSIDIIALKIVTKILGINPTVLGAPRVDSLVIIAFQTAEISFYVLTQWTLMPLRPILFWLFPFRQ